jgi:hypothetical protein
MEFAGRQFTDVTVGWPHEERSHYWADVAVPYQAKYAYEETLAVFGDRPGVADSLLASYERIAARITGNAVTRLPPRQEWLRLRTWQRFSRTPSAIPVEIIIDFSPQDQLWAEWIAAVLADAGLSARLVGEPTAEPGHAGQRSQIVGVLSEAYLSRFNDSPDVADGDLPDLLIAVTHLRALPGIHREMPVISLVNLSESEAVDRLVETFEGVSPPEHERVADAMRYPGGH